LTPKAEDVVMKSFYIKNQRSKGFSQQVPIKLHARHCAGL
jgi:hypothetical protein